MKKLSLMLLLLFSAVSLNVFAQDAVQNTQSATAGANDPSQKLDENIESLFKSLKSDPAPKNLVRNSHYWVSNEHSHYVWYPYIKDKGGVISGVGTDQVYLLAGWTNASIIIPMDFDHMVTSLHYAYGAAFMASDSIEDFLKFWKKDGAEKMKAALNQYFPEHTAEAMDSWTRGNAEINRRLNRVAKKYSSSKSTNNLEIPTFVTDETQFRRIKQLWENHRVFPICGDLTGNVAMLDIARVLNASGLKLKFLYPSNAEHYFEYGPAFRRNIIQMPFAEDSMILRTRQLTVLGVASDGDYHYNIQSGPNFQAWMKSTNVKDQLVMLKKREKTATKGLSIFNDDPVASENPPEIAPLP